MLVIVCDPYINAVTMSRYQGEINCLQSLCRYAWGVINRSIIVLVFSAGI